MVSPTCERRRRHGRPRARPRPGAGPRPGRRGRRPSRASRPAGRRSGRPTGGAREPRGVSSRAPRPPVPPPGPRSARPAATARRRRQYVAAETRGGRPRPAGGIGTNVRWTGRSASSTGYLGSDLGVVMTAAIWFLHLLRAWRAGKLRTGVRGGRSRCGTIEPRGWDSNAWRRGDRAPVPRTGRTGRTSVRCPTTQPRTSVRSQGKSTNRCLPRTPDRVTFPGMAEGSTAHRPSAAGPRVHRRRGPAPRATHRACGRSARPSASRRAPRCTPTSVPCRTRATCAVTPRSPGRSRSATSPTPAPSWTAAPSATSRSSVTSRPAPACSRPRTSKRRCPLPEDLTGDGQLFMLRVRGESMIDAGIFDRDYVVVRQQDDRRQRRHRRRRHPGRGSDREDVPAQAGQDHPAAGERGARGHGLRPAEITIYGKVVTVLRKL